jgi:hypothetical protein
MAEQERTLLAQTLRTHLIGTGQATAGPLAQVVDAKTRETYATKFTLESPLGNYTIEIVDAE